MPPVIHPVRFTALPLPRFLRLPLPEKTGGPEPETAPEAVAPKPPKDFAQNTRARLLWPNLPWHYPDRLIRLQDDPRVQALQPSRLVHQVQQRSPEQLLQDFQRASDIGEFVPVVLPKAEIAPNLIGAGYAGFDVFQAARRTYAEHEALSPRERWLQTAKATGEVALFHLVATITLPGLVGKWTHERGEQLLTHPKSPRWLARRARFSAGVLTAGAVLLTAGVINKAVDLALDWTYRPLVSRQKPRDWERVQGRLITLQDFAGRLWQERMQPWWQTHVTPRLEARRAFKPEPRPSAFYVPSDTPLAHPVLFQAFVEARTPPAALSR